MSDKVIDFSIPGKPRGKARPRVVNGHAYTPESTAAYETQVRLAFKQAVKGQWNYYHSPLHIHITAFYKIPERTSKEKRMHMRSGEIKPTIKPDIDNIIKIVMDALNKLAYHDDSQVVELHAEKAYSDKPRVFVMIFVPGWEKELEEENNDAQN